MGRCHERKRAPRADCHAGANEMSVAAKRVIVLTDEMQAPLEREFPEEYSGSSSAVLFAIRAVAQRINDEANGWLAPFGLNAASYNYLVMLYASPQRSLTQNQIRQIVHTTHASVAQMVRSLEQDGLVKRRKNPLDARSVVVRLTPKGVRRVRTAIPVHHRTIEAKLRFLSEAKRRQLLALLVDVDRGFVDTLPPARQNGQTPLTSEAR